MIYLYSGTPGGGKSLHMARDIMNKLRRGQDVIANFPINIEEIEKGLFGFRYKAMGNFTYLDNSELTVEFLVNYARKNHKIGKEGQTLICVDECQVIFNSRDFSNKSRMAWIKFFSQHRKLGYNVILVAQNDRMIDRQIRVLTEYEQKHRKANNFGSIGMLLPFKLFACVTYWYGVREKVGVEFFTFSKKLSRIYDSYQMFDDDVVSVNIPAETKSGEVSALAEGTHALATAEVVVVN